MKNHITVYIMRHGETHWNAKKKSQGHAKSQLNSVGRKQAQRAAEFFKDICLHTIYCSPLVRTMQTAKAILKYHHPSKLVKCPELAERNIGSMQGLTHKQIRKRIPDIEEQWKRDRFDWRPPGNSESMKELFNRSCNGFEKIVKKHRLGDKFLIITHGGPIKCILHKLHKGRLDKSILHSETPKNCEIIEILWNRKPLRVTCLMK